NDIPANTVAGAGTDGDGLYVVLSDEISGLVVASELVANQGSFHFEGIDKGYYTATLSTVFQPSGTALVAGSLHAGWLSTGERNGTGAGTDGFPNAALYLGLQSADNNQLH